MAHPRARTGWLHDDHKVQREFERVGKFLLDDEKAVGALASAIGISTTDLVNNGKDNPAKIALWALTVFVDKKLVKHKKVVQGLNFEGKDLKTPVTFFSPIVDIPLKWEIENRQLNKEYRTIDEAEVSDIGAWARIPFGDLAWVDGIQSVQVDHKLRKNLDILYGIKGETWEQTVHLLNDEYSPGNNMFYGTNEYGFKGWQALTPLVGGVLEVDISYSDFPVGGTKVIGTLPANKKVLKVSVIVNVPFDGGLQVTIGTSSSEGQIATVKDIDMNTESTYHIEPDISYAIDTELSIYQALNTSTIGNGKVIIYYL